MYLCSYFHSIITHFLVLFETAYDFFCDLIKFLCDPKRMVSCGKPVLFKKNLIEDTYAIVKS